MKTIQSNLWHGLFGRAAKRWKILYNKGEQYGRYVPLLFLLIGIMFFFQGCEKPAVPVDVISVTPSGASPGAIIKIAISEPSKHAQYHVMFEDSRVTPLRTSDEFLTVMVPYLEAGYYTVGVVPENKKNSGDTKTFTIKAPARITGREAQNLFKNVSKLFDFSEDYTLFAYEGIGGSSENAEKLEEGFYNCNRLINEALNALYKLPVDDEYILCELIQGAQLDNVLTKSLEILEDDHITKYHELLGKATILESLTNTEFFFLMTRLDLISAIITDFCSIIKGLKQTSLLASFEPTLGDFKSYGAWSTLSALEYPLKLADAILDGVIPTDLKQIRLEVMPETGAVLNPGEFASLTMIGTFGQQEDIEELVADTTLNITTSGILDDLQNEIRKYLKDVMSIQNNLRESVSKTVWDDIAKIFVLGGLDIDDSLFPISWKDVTLNGKLLDWAHDIPVSPDYYYYDPLGQLATGFGSLIPSFGNNLSTAFQGLILNIMGEDSVLPNSVISVDNNTILSDYDRSTGLIYAKKAGTTTIHAQAYRFDKVFSLLSLYDIEGWNYLKEGEKVTLPTGAIETVNTPLKVTVSTAKDPVYSDFADSPISGVLPGIFTTDGGTFQISVSPLDENGELLYRNLAVSNFSFSPIYVAPLAYPDTPVTFGTATPDYIESILPGGPNKVVNTAIILDSSGSMDWNDTNRDRVIAAKSFVDMLGVGDQAAIFDFGAGYTSGFGDTRLLQDFTSDHTLLYEAIDLVRDSGGTPMYESLYETLDYIYGTGLPSLSVIVLTDGEANSARLFDDVVSKAQSMGIPIFAVGLGYDVDFTQLQALASQTGGTFASANDAMRLMSLFENIGAAVKVGRVIIHATGGFTPAIQNTGPYVVSGELRTKISGLTIPTPFDFRVDVVSSAQGLKLKMVHSE